MFYPVWVYQTSNFASFEATRSVPRSVRNALKELTQLLPTIVLLLAKEVQRFATRRNRGLGIKNATSLLKCLVSQRQYSYCYYYQPDQKRKCRKCLRISHKYLNDIVQDVITFKLVRTLYQTFVRNVPWLPIKKTPSIAPELATACHITTILRKTETKLSCSVNQDHTVRHMSSAYVLLLLIMKSDPRLYDVLMS